MSDVIALIAKHAELSFGIIYFNAPVRLGAAIWIWWFYFCLMLSVMKVWFKPLANYISKSIKLGFDSNNSWFTQSDALARSQDIPPTCILLSRALKISFVKLNRALSVEIFFLNPNFSPARMLFEFKKSFTLLYITF
jgi:hypothetical protein